MRPDRGKGAPGRAHSHERSEQLARSLAVERIYETTLTPVETPSPPHVLFDGHAPTPFTADQIRGASPAGHTTKVLIETKDNAPIIRTTTFVVVDDNEAELEFVEASATDPSVHITGGSRVRWEDLQAHASFPLDRVEVADETIELPWGELECLRYTVSDESGTTIHWFAKAHPGMPVRTNVWNGSELVQTSTVLSIEDR